MHTLARLLLAASCVTSLPLGEIHKEPQDLAGLSKYLPAVGLLIGLALLAVAALSRMIWLPHLLAGGLVTLIWVILTGAIHLDGLMDTADGIFSHRSQERMLEIMRDSRVGNFGVLAGVGIVLAKFTALASANYPALMLSALIVPVWARWCETFAIGYFSYLREHGMGKIWHDTTRFPNDVLSAAAFPLVVTAALCAFFNWQLVIATSALGVICGIAAAFRINSILRGHTGDTYGAVVELSEAGALLLSALLLPQWRL